jgi:hypothetical protein
MSVDARPRDVNSTDFRFGTLNSPKAIGRNLLAVVGRERQQSPLKGVQRRKLLLPLGQIGGDKGPEIWRVRQAHFRKLLPEQARRLREQIGRPCAHDGRVQLKAKDVMLHYLHV